MNDCKKCSIDAPIIRQKKICKYFALKCLFAREQIKACPHIKTNLMAKFQHSSDTQSILIAPEVAQGDLMGRLIQQQLFTLLLKYFNRNFNYDYNLMTVNIENNFEST